MIEVEGRGGKGEEAQIAARLGTNMRNISEQCMAIDRAWRTASCAIWSSRHASRLSPQAEPAVRNDEQRNRVVQKQHDSSRGLPWGPMMI